MSAECFHFVCQSESAGLLHLQLTPGAIDSQLRGAVRDALVLHEMESLTQALETTVASEIDWLPAQSCHPEPCDQLIQLTAQDLDSELVSMATLSLSPAVLPHLASRALELPESLSVFSWQPVKVMLLLSDMQLTAPEKENLGNGALLILPESFHSTWTSTLLLHDGSYRINGSYQVRQDTWTAASSDVEQAVNGDEKNCRVQFSCCVDSQALMHSNQVLSIGLLNTQQPQLASVIVEDQAVFAGPLLPVGDGHAVLLDQPAVVAVQSTTDVL